jgi:hypothetical protein
VTAGPLLIRRLRACGHLSRPGTNRVGQVGTFGAYVETDICLRAGVVEHPKYGGRRIFGAGINSPGAETLAMGRNGCARKLGAGICYFFHHKAGIYTGRVVKTLWGGSGEYISIAALTGLAAQGGGSRHSCIEVVGSPAALVHRIVFMPAFSALN